MKIKFFVPMLILSVLTIIFSGCGTVQKGLYFHDGVSELPQKKYQVKRISQESFAVFLGYEDFLRSELENRLQKRSLLAPEGANDVLILDTYLVEYDPGDLAMRWVLGFGAGATYAEMYVDIVDQSKGISLGGMHVQETIECCGLFTAGADKRIFGHIAKRIVTLLERGKAVQGVTPHDLVLDTMPNERKFRYSRDNIFRSGTSSRVVPDVLKVKGKSSI